MMSKLPVAREGWPFIAIPAAIAAGLALVGRRGLALPFAAASLASLGFFRDPERETPAIPGAVLSPADGSVISVDVRILHPGAPIGVRSSGSGPPKPCVFETPNIRIAGRCAIAGRVQSSCRATTGRRGTRSSRWSTW